MLSAFSNQRNNFDQPSVLAAARGSTQDAYRWKAIRVHPAATGIEAETEDELERKKFDIIPVDTRLFASSHLLRRLFHFAVSVFSRLLIFARFVLLEGGRIFASPARRGRRRSIGPQAPFNALPSDRLQLVSALLLPARTQLCNLSALLSFLPYFLNLPSLASSLRYYRFSLRTCVVFVHQNKPSRIRIH